MHSNTVHAKNKLITVSKNRNTFSDTNSDQFSIFKKSNGDENDDDNLRLTCTLGQERSSKVQYRVGKCFQLLGFPTTLSNSRLHYPTCTPKLTFEADIGF